MDEYEKRGYLNQNFRIFHPIDYSKREFAYHYHDFYKILIFLSGDVTYCIEGKSYPLSPYDTVLVNAGEVHRPIVHSSGAYERIILYVSPQFLRSYREEYCDLTLCFARAQQGNSSVLRMPSMKNSRLYQTLAALEASQHSMEYGSALYQKVLFLEFMIHLNRAAAHNPLKVTAANDSNDKTLAILSYLNGHLTEDLTIDAIAETFFTSKYYLMHSFKKETGYTIGGYLNLKRLLYGRELIQQGIPATEACFACGFRNYSTFYRAYKKQFGEAPARR